MHKLTNWHVARSGARLTLSGYRNGKLVKLPAVRITGPDDTRLALPKSIVAWGLDGEPIILDQRDGEGRSNGPDTSAEVASIAGELMNLSGDDLDNVSHDDPANRDQLLAKIHAVAGSAMGQRQ